MSGEQDLTQKQNYMSLRQLPKNTWLTKGRRMLRAGKVHVLCLACSLLLEEHYKCFLSNPACYSWVQERHKADESRCYIWHLSSCLWFSSSARDPQVGNEQLEV